MIRPRSKPRPGRLKGEDMVSLRRLVFERDGYRCQHPVHVVGIGPMVCGIGVTWESGHLCHRRNRRMWGDTPENTFCGCSVCHDNQHRFGPSYTKPVPAKGSHDQA